MVRSCSEGRGTSVPLASWMRIARRPESRKPAGQRRSRLLKARSPGSTPAPARHAGGARRPPGGWLLAALVSGAGLEYLFDPDRGGQRRERATAAVRHSARRLTRRGRAKALQSLGRSRGALHRLAPSRPGEPLDEAALTHKVESVLFRDTHVPKGKISINAERGTVFLRGQVDDAQLIDYVAEAVARIPGVSEVVNLLHQPGTPAPHPGAEPLAAHSHAHE